MEIIRNAKIEARNKNCYRYGEDRYIQGVKIIKPSEKIHPRLCYEVMFNDGEIDYISLGLTQGENSPYVIK